MIMNAKMLNFGKKFTSKENKLYANLNRLKDKFKNLDEYIKENNDEKVYTKNKLNEATNNFHARLNELHENKMEIATLKSDAETYKKKLNKNKEDIKRYKSIISDAKKKTINELEKKLRQKGLDNENTLINEIKELKEYKEK